MRRKIVLVMLIICIAVCCSCTSKYDSFVLKAQNAIDEEAYSDAVEFCNEAIDLEPDTADAYAVRGEAYQYEKEYQKAIEDYQKAISLGDKTVYGKLGRTYRATEDTDNAIKYMKKQIESDNQDSDTYEDLIELYNEKGMYKEARDTKVKGYDATGDERFKVLAFSESEASELGGLFILSGQKFYMLQPAGEERNQYFRSAYKYTDSENEDIPVLCDGDKLVFFSPNDLEESYPLYKVDRSGYTFPAYFFALNSYDPASISGHEIALPNYDSSEQKMKAEDVGDSFRVKNIEKINGMSYADYYKKNVVEDGIAEVEKNASIEYAYHDGSEYKEASLDACLKFYHRGQELSLQGNLTESSYGELNTSSLSEGTYLMPFELNKKYLFYISNNINYIFRVAK